MADVVVQLAETSEDFDAARTLCQEWLDWHWRNYPSDWPTGDDHPMAPKAFQTVLDTLPELHKRPLGGVLLALLNDQPVGCVMFSEAAPGVAEFNRMFVSEAGRGFGLGRKLLDQMFEQLVADGYEKVIFSSASFLTHARKMYEDAGFVPMAQPDGFPEEWRDKIYFMERILK